MNLFSSAMRFSLFLSTAVLLAGLATLSSAIPAAIRVILPALAAGLVGAAGWRAMERSRTRMAEQLSVQDAAVASAAKAAGQMRHDLRGMLSPALLNADRLSTSTDPGARRAADAMIVAIERMEIRLREG